jgi:hypothetical protein
MASTEKQLRGIPREEEKRVREYTIVYHNIPGQLSRLVDAHLADGWECVGGASVDPRDGAFYQAMVKRW